MANELTVSLHQVGLRLSSGRDDFLAFTRAYLEPLIATEKAAPSIDVTLTWDAQLPTADQPRWEQLGRRLWANAHRLRWSEIWQVPGLQMDVRWEDEGLIIKGAYTWPTRRAKWGARWMAPARERLFVSLIYYLVYFPWAWRLERDRGWTLLHASAIATPEGNLVLSGLPGCGKSTTALASLGHSTWQVVSDNLLFTDGHRVFACPEPIHVDERTRALIGGLDGRVRPTDRRFSHRRRDYELAPQARRRSATPRALGFLHLGPETGVHPIDSDVAAHRLMANDYLAKEWMAYQDSAAALHQIWPEVGDQERRRENLIALAHLISCYEVTVARGGDVRQAMETITGAMLYG